MTGNVVGRRRMLPAAGGAAGSAFVMLIVSANLSSLQFARMSARRRELAVRLALGANLRDVLRLVLRQGMALTIIGLTIGLAAAFALTRLMSKLLFGVSVTDPLTFVGVALLLAAVALLACWAPARRASRVDPLVALRHD